MIYNKIIFDSCVFIALYNKNDDFHMEALNIFEYYKDSIILISSYVVQEVCTVLTYKFWKEKANIFIEDITNANNVLLLQSDTMEEMKFFRSINKKISFTDLSLLYLASKQDCLLITFDEQLLKLYKKTYK